MFKNSCAVLCVLSLCVCNAAYSNEPTVPSSEESEVLAEPLVFDQLRIWQEESYVAEYVTIISKEDIAALPATNLAEVLQYVPGVSYDTRTAFSHGGTYGLHTSYAEETRIMIDGIRFNSEISGQVSLHAIPLANIERIEIVKGALSSRWGSALGGVINVVTKDVGDSVVPHGQVAGMLSEYGQRRVSSDVYGGVQGFGYYFSGGYGEAGGLRNYDDTQQRHASGKVSYTYGDLLSLDVSGGYIDSNESDELSYYPNAWFKQQYYSRYGKVTADVAVHERVHVRMNAKVNNQAARSLYDYSSAGARSEYHDFRWSIDGECVMNLREKDVFVVGAETLYDKVRAQNGFLPQSASMNTYAGYANYSFVFDPVSVTAGVRYDHHSDYKDQVSPSLGCVIALPYVPQTRIRASVARGFNAPPLAWRYYSSGGYIPNSQLKPQRSLMYSVGLESRPMPRLWTRLNLFRSDVKDFIDVETVGANYQFRNKDKFRFSGIEAEARIDILKGLYVTAAGTITDVEDRATGENSYSISNARNSVKVGLYYNTVFGTRCSVLGNYMRFRADGYQPHESKLVWDMKISQDIPIYNDVRTTGYVAVRNLFNSAFWNDEYFPHPGRYFEGGVTIHF